MDLKYSIRNGGSIVLKLIALLTLFILFTLLTLRPLLTLLTLFKQLRTKKANMPYGCMGLWASELLSKKWDG